MTVTFSMFWNHRSVGWLDAGDGEDFDGGPIRESGYYAFPFCMPECCRPQGPFPTEAAAEQWLDAVAKAIEGKMPDEDMQRTLARE